MTKPNRSILVVDDNEAVVEVLTLGLQNHGFHTSSAKDGWEAVNKMFHGNHDAIVLDINMPKMDGITTVKALRKSDPHTYILLISGEAEDFKVQQALSNGANAFLQKPFTVAAILEHFAKVDFQQITESKQVLKEEKARLIRESQVWHRRLTGYLKSSRFKRNLVFGIIILAVASLVGFLTTCFMERQTFQNKKDVYLQKMDDLIEVIRQDWGR